MPSRRKYLYYLIAIILIAIILRLPAFLYGYVNIDETDYALAAQTILKGGLPYRDFLIYQPPAIYYIYALGFWLSGGAHLWSVHIITIIFVIGTVISLYYLTKLLTRSERGGLAAALAYAVYSTTFIPQDMLAANCELLMMFPLTLSVLLLYKATQGHYGMGPTPALASQRLFFLSGIMIGLGVLTKYQGGIVLITALAYLVVIQPLLKKRFNWAEVIFPSLVLMLGFITPFLFLILYLLHKGALSSAYEAFLYIVLYARGPVQSDALYVLLKFIARSLLFALPTLPVWIGSIYVIKRTIKNRFRDPDLPPYTLLIILLFLLSIIPIIMGGRIYFHYYLIILPAASILAGMWWNLRGPIMKPIFRHVIIAWLVICTIGWSTFAVYQAVRGPGRKETWVDTAAYLKKIARPGETLFVWGLCYQLYFFSGLELGSRFTSADYLTGKTPMTAGLEYNPEMPNPPSSFQKLWNDFADRPGVVIFDTSYNIFPPAWKYLQEDFERRLPTYIVDTSPSNYRRYDRYPIQNFQFLHEVLRTSYEFIKEIDGYNIYKRKLHSPLKILIIE